MSTQINDRDWISMYEILRDGTLFEKNMTTKEAYEPDWVNPVTGLTVKLDKRCFMDGQMIISKAVSKLPPDAMRVVKDESVSDLMCRIRYSHLDNAHYRNRGRIGWMVTRLNELPHKQPKRLTFSAVVDSMPTTSLDHGKHLFRLNLYNSNCGIPLEDWRCRPMEREIYELGKYLWGKVHNRLSTMSKVFPPNSCQINFYYEALDGKMTKHRDYGSGGGRGRNKVDSEDCQIQGTSVISFSVGAPMMFSQYRYDETNSKGCVSVYDRYVTDEGLSTMLWDGSCIVLHPKDDEIMLHGARFKKGGGDGVRAVFNYRWCQNWKWFYDNNHPMKSLRCAVANHLEIEDEDIKWNFLLEGRDRNYGKEDWEREIKSKGYTMHKYYND